MCVCVCARAPAHARARERVVCCPRGVPVVRSLLQWIRSTALGLEGSEFSGSGSGRAGECKHFCTMLKQGKSQSRLQGLRSRVSGSGWLETAGTCLTRTHGSLPAGCFYAP